MDEGAEAPAPAQPAPSPRAAPTVEERPAPAPDAPRADAATEARAIEAKPGAKPLDVIDFDSLEAEMSRLLGREPAPKG
jgi:hypothetical protein